MQEKKEKLLYLFVLLNPIFDLISSLFSHYGYRITGSTILRPIIPLFLIIYIFITDNKTRRKIFILSFVYLSYAIVHLLLYKGLITDFSYGSLIHEAQYLANYTYLIFTFFTFIYIFNKKDDKQLKKAILTTSLFYIITIYLAIITNTSFSSYVEGVGYKGWFNTSGAVGTLLTLSLFITIPYLIKIDIKKYYKFAYIFFIIFYLYYLIGSRVGLMGSLLVIITTIFSIIIYNIIKKKKNFHLEIILPMIMVIFLSLFISSNTFTRRIQLDEMTDQDKHIAYDLKDEIDKIDSDDKSNDNYILKEQELAMKSLEEYANITEIDNVNLRKQQLIYHTYLWKYQKSIPLKLFGNGYLTNMGMLTLEMESIALLFNFGLIGFILYYLPFLLILLWGIYIGLKNIKKLDIEYIMLLGGSITSFGISTLSGHTFFNTSVMIIIIVLNALLLNKILKLRSK